MMPFETEDQRDNVIVQSMDKSFEKPWEKPENNLKTGFINYINSLRPFKFKMSELLKSTYLKYIGCCLRLRRRPSKKFNLFKDGISKLQDKFEITNLIRSI